MPKAFFGSISSDLACNVAAYLQAKNWHIEGTYRNLSHQIEELSSKGAKLYKLDFNNSSEIEQLFEDKLIAKDWKFSMISPSIIGKLGRFGEINWNEWNKTFQLNSLSQFNLIHKILPRKIEKEQSILWLWGGPGTNNAPKEHSALILAKIAQIKFVEILNEEYEDLIPIAIGPGWVKTKTHDEVLKMGEKAGYKYKEVVERIESGNFTSMQTILDFLDWILSQEKKVIGGRNFSIRSDIWGDFELEEFLKKNKDAFKLRRFFNDWRPDNVAINFNPK